MNRTIHSTSTFALVLVLVGGVARAQSPAAPASVPPPATSPKTDGDDEGARLLRRAAYYETQKSDASKALEIYEDVVARFPDSRVALQAMERIASLDEQAGKAADAQRERELATALRAKIGVPEPEASKEPRRRGALRERIRKLLGTERRDEAKGDGKASEGGPTDAAKTETPSPRPAATPELSDLGKKIEEWKKEGLSKEEIRERVRNEVKALAKKERKEAKHEAKESAKEERREELRERRADAKPLLPPEVRKLVEKMKAEGKSEQEIRAAVRRALARRRRHHQDADDAKDSQPAPREV